MKKSAFVLIFLCVLSVDAMQPQKTTQPSISSKQMWILGGTVALGAVYAGLNYLIISQQIEMNKKKVPAYFEDLSHKELIWNAFTGDAEYMRHAINSKVDLNHIEKGKSSILWYAVTKNHPKVVQLLLQAKANPNLRGDPDNFPLLSAAAQGCSLKIVKSLVDAQADVEQKDRHGNNALVCAGRNYSLTSDQKLLISIKTVFSGIGSINQQNCYKIGKYLVDHAGADASHLTLNEERTAETKKFRDRYNFEKRHAMLTFFPVTRPSYVKGFSKSFKAFWRA